MRISTSQMFNQTINSVLDKQTSTSKILDQLSSGKRVNTAGDDPVASLGIDNLNQQNALVDQFMKNIDYANNRLSLSESKLGTAETLVASTREQVIRAINGGMSTSERQMIADELRGTLEELLAVANTRDESGNYIFGGNQTGQQPFAFDNAGDIVYSGDNGARQSVIASGVTVATNIPGDTAFMNAPSGLGDYSANYLASQVGDFSVDSAKITSQATYVEDTYTFTMVGANLEVRDSSSALVTTEVGFDPANPVSFNGMEVKLDGLPANGDSFSITPQSEVSIFDTINQAIALIEDANKVNTPQGVSELAQILNNIDSGVNQLSIARSETGNSLKSLDSYSTQHVEEKLVNSSTLSMLEDLDYASAITEFEKQQLALNAVSSVFSKVGSVSLFDYI
ncbi:flagellar hook-associated protein FlgL [Shewanella sp. D64]|uniref:flagellar hook-associated protein FlgL n=1 Tax=unclassified Shewanella TaxID=196818 RepID=UPI0022BA5734|nr:MULTISPECIES: flagellar hook-associated protein FlgL [unclassified Shewanella]MEC4726522.1 flagellar hook-associated protein FlgL [Shewanella sp. D64]MEC4737437.1 flagellar hook-associated protein FlgL [Shewanella sp. E94]WBJ97253.1 flagellar hook-associated protein FlgL [Shewanella sp. MTB7]